MGSLSASGREDLHLRLLHPQHGQLSLADQHKCANCLASGGGDDLCEMGSEGSNRKIVSQISPQDPVAPRLAGIPERPGPGRAAPVTGGSRATVAVAVCARSIGWLRGAIVEDMHMHEVGREGERDAPRRRPPEPETP